MSTLRVRLHFVGEFSLGEWHRVWFVVPSSVQRVSDLTWLLQETFSLRKQASGILLSVDGFLLPPTQTIDILRENDVITVMKTHDSKRKTMQGETPGNHQRSTKRRKLEQVAPASHAAVEPKSGDEDSSSSEEEDGEIEHEKPARVEESSSSDESSSSETESSSSETESSSSEEEEAEKEESVPSCTDKEKQTPADPNHQPKPNGAESVVPRGHYRFSEKGTAIPLSTTHQNAAISVPLGQKKTEAHPVDRPSSSAKKRDYNALPVLDLRAKQPKRGGMLAYRILQVQAGGPTLSPFKEAEVVGFDGATGIVTLRASSTEFLPLDGLVHAEQGDLSPRSLLAQTVAVPLEHMQDVRFIS